MPDDNGQLKQLEDLSVQRRAKLDEAVNSSTSLSFFFGRDNRYERFYDYSIIPPYWSESRDISLHRFTLLPGNDILQGAISSVIKKFSAMNWLIEGPQRVVNRYQKLLLNAEFWQGWQFLLAKTLRDYFTRDKGAFWELIGDGNINDIIKGPVLGVAHLDSSFCQLTGDIEFPVLFHSTKTGKAHALHASRVAHMVDMPSPNEALLNTGFCATSRVVGSSEILLKLNQYKNEKLDDLPEAGLLLLNNVLPSAWEDTNAEHERKRRNLGHEIWSNVQTFFGIDPATPATAELISFANLPDSFDELQTTNIYVNILALAFGVDVREFWPITGGALGTATESEVMHQKARGKGVGEIISMLERIINWKILPESVTFRFDFKNDEEDLLAADIDDKRTNTIMNMWRPGEETPVNVLEIRQMLADNVSYFSEEFLQVDLTPEGEASDSESDKRLGPLVQMDNKGLVKRVNSRNLIRPMVDDAIDMAVENYQKGLVTAEEVAEFTLGLLVDRKMENI